MPGQPPSALTRSSAVIGFSGVSGGVSIETLRRKIRRDPENHSLSFDNRSLAPEQPDTADASTMNARTRVSFWLVSRTMDLLDCLIWRAASQSPPEIDANVWTTRPALTSRPTPLCGTTVALPMPRRRCAQENGRLSLIAIEHNDYCRRCQRPRSSACQ